MRPGAAPVRMNARNAKAQLNQLVRPRGFEPLTFCSGGKRSIQLSYGRGQFHCKACGNLTVRSSHDPRRGG
jgi:predicted RNA-binding Zn-ribbon protein involved in translation (DUF1610 family)